MPLFLAVVVDLDESGGSLSPKISKIYEAVTSSESQTTASSGMTEIFSKFFGFYFFGAQSKNI